MQDMKRLLQAAPTLASLNTTETVHFYEEKMGFRRTYFDEGYLIVVRDDIQIHFWKCDDKIHPENTSCYVYVSGVDDLYKELQAAGIVHPNGKLEDKPWGMREFAILDVHGNLIRFGQLLEK